MKSNLFNKFLTSSVFAVVLSFSVAHAQSLPQGVQDVVKMKQAGLSDDIILAQIKNSGATYNLSVDQILSLKNQNVSDAVIKALISGSGGSTAAAPAPAEATPPPAAPAANGGPAPAAPPAPMATAAPVTPPLAPGAPAAPPVAAAPDMGPPPSFDSFQAQLAPYGTWVQVPGYGLCWQPTASLTDPMWRPYFDGGHWVYTDEGWSWQSDYPWGNIVFHYGRWYRAAGVWTWVPGYDYAPAWVAWREADGYNGWAPLPPAAVFRPGLGLYYNGVLATDVDFGLGPDDFTFVAYDHFWDYHLRTWYVPHDRVVIFFGHSHIMNGYRMDHGHFFVGGLGRDHIALVTHHDIRVEHDMHARYDVHGGGRYDPHGGRYDGHDGHDGRDGHDRH